MAKRTLQILLAISNPQKILSRRLVELIVSKIISDFVTENFIRFQIGNGVFVDARICFWLRRKIPFTNDIEDVGFLLSEIPDMSNQWLRYCHR